MTRWFRTVTKCGQDTKNKEERHIKTPNRHSPCGNTLLDGKTRSPRQIGRLKSMEYRNSRFIAIHVKYLDGELPDGHSKSGGIPDKYLINTWKIPATCKNTCLKNRRIKVVLKVVLKVFNIYVYSNEITRNKTIYEYTKYN